jgi:hypothetical protein
MIIEARCMPINTDTWKSETGGSQESRPVCKTYKTLSQEKKKAKHSSVNLQSQHLGG